MTAVSDAQRHLSARVLAALDARVVEASRVVLPPSVVESALEEPAGTVTAVLLPQLVAAARRPNGQPEAWLLFVALLGRFPTTAEFLRVMRAVELEPPDIMATTLLAQALGSRGPYMDRGMRVVTDRPVVEVAYSAMHDHHSGIQRVVRETVPRWAAAHPLELVAWTTTGDAFRTLTPREQGRVLEWTGPIDDPTVDAAFPYELVVPFRTDVLLPDVPVAAQAPTLAAVARFSGNRLGHVGYDLIPMTSADLRPDGEASATASQFSVVKHSHRVACISGSAASEFSGLVQALPTQGLVGPEVRTVLLPAVGAPLPASGGSRRQSTRPVILVTGTREPHKNQRTVLHAAERLWREGLDFEVRQAGGEGWSDRDYAPAVERLIAARRPLTLLGRVSEQTLWDEMRAADAVAFISLHEGYGLPIAEALSVGTPVITTNFGSQAEVAAEGGCLLVDPRDDDDVTAALRRIVTEPALRASLAAEAVQRPVRTWDDYASALWAFLVDGVTTEGGQR
ncbi:glycosyltransferase [Xylanimonas allomyrinae]|uniref:Glycosyltransferase n=1 Tax=Xylanimonas allomyrinae TaxID=2509459 RepID=A0A4P6EL85_9MICO|nr:glycosyltransferase [Xylanimonas allomyrinae]QAY63404.1 glycosyltransferase [Xylanimonas allomyrinae]